MGIEKQNEIIIFHSTREREEENNKQMGPQNQGCTREC